MSKQIEMTQEAFDKLEKELMDMKALRPEIAQEIQEARSHGDLSENSEYDAALDKQAKHEERIAALEEMKKHAKIIDESSIKKGVVSVGSVVGVHDFDLEEDVEYHSFHHRIRPACNSRKSFRPKPDRQGAARLQKGRGSNR